MKLSFAVALVLCSMYDVNYWWDLIKKIDAKENSVCCLQDNSIFTRSKIICWYILSLQFFLSRLISCIRLNNGDIFAAHTRFKYITDRILKWISVSYNIYFYILVDFVVVVAAVMIFSTLSCHGWCNKRRAKIAYCIHTI